MNGFLGWGDYFPTSKNHLLINSEAIIITTKRFCPIAGGNELYNSKSIPIYYNK